MSSPSSSEPPDRNPPEPPVPPERVSSETGRIIVRILVSLVVMAIVGFGLLVGFCSLGK